MILESPERNPNSSRFQRVQIGSIMVHDVTVPEILALVREAVRHRRRLTLCYANAHAIRLAATDSQFARDLAAADVVFCDGYGVQLASRLLGQPLRARMTPPAWLEELVQALEPEHARFFLVGDEPRTVSRAAEGLEAHYPPAKAVGVHHGFFPLQGQENENLLKAINAADATVLLVGMGMPRQERWLTSNAARLDAPVILAVGALFTRLAGIEPRPHPWIANHGLEWLTRLVRHPVVMFDRYVMGIPRFAGILVQQWWRARREGRQFP